MLRVHAAEKDAGADVAEFAIRGARGAPVLSRTWKWVGWGVDLDKSVELGGVDGRELVFDPVFKALRGCNISGHKNGAFVRVITKETSLSVFSNNRRRWFNTHKSLAPSQSGRIRTYSVDSLE